MAKVIGLTVLLETTKGPVSAHVTRSESEASVAGDGVEMYLQAWGEIRKKLDEMITPTM